MERSKPAFDYYYELKFFRIHATILAQIYRDLTATRRYVIRVRTLLDRGQLELFDLGRELNRLEQQIAALKASDNG